MFGRGRPPVLARVPLDQAEDGRPGTLDRRGLAALLELWSEVNHGVVLVTGHEERSDLAIAMAPFVQQWYFRPEAYSPAPLSSMILMATKP